MFDIKKGNGKFHSKTDQLTLLMNTYILPSTMLTIPFPAQLRMPKQR
jgi:hypothetical protein